MSKKLSMFDFEKIIKEKQFNEFKMMFSGYGFDLIFCKPDQKSESESFFKDTPCIFKKTLFRYNPNRFILMRNEELQANKNHYISINFVKYIVLKEDKKGKCSFDIVCGHLHNDKQDRRYFFEAVCR